jgi:hypothetical protein
MPAQQATSKQTTSNKVHTTYQHEGIARTSSSVQCVCRRLSDHLRQVRPSSRPCRHTLQRHSRPGHRRSRRSRPPDRRNRCCHSHHQRHTCCHRPARQHRSVKEHSCCPVLRQCRSRSRCRRPSRSCLRDQGKRKSWARAQWKPHQRLPSWLVVRHCCAVGRRLLLLRASSVEPRCWRAGRRRRQWARRSRQHRQATARLHLHRRRSPTALVETT